MKKFSCYILAVTALVMLSGCEGIFNGIYDDPPRDDVFEEGFHAGTAPNRMVLQLKATNYDEWIYVDLHNRTIERKPIPQALTGEWDGVSGMTYHLVEGSRYTELSQTQTDPQIDAQQWDLAIHHFDVKTNGGEVALAGSDNFVKDIWTDNQVIVDMREMMGYKIGYQRSMVNPLLTAWATMDFSTPPPVYSASGDTYILKMKDGSRAQIYLRSYISPRGTKGYLTIDITYPL